VASTLSARLQTIGAHSARAAHITSTAATVLQRNAGTYREQEALTAASLHPGGGAAAGALAASTAGMVAVAAPPVPTPVVPASAPAGVTPTGGKSIAALIHGGAGPGPLLAAADRARAHVTELREISTSLLATTARLAQVWQSPAAEAVIERISGLARWYDNHAEHTTTVARACEDQADNFARTRAAVPRPEEFDDLERRLENATRANVAARGAYIPVIAELQTQLAATHTRAVTAYADYSTRAADLRTADSTSPPPTVHAVDYTGDIKEAPPGPVPERPWEYNNGYTTTVNARGPDGTIVDGGTLVSLDDVWNELHRCFNCNRTAEEINIEFATLPGHADGPGSTIHFRWTEQAGAPHLDIRGYTTEGPGSGDNPFSAPARVGYTAFAELVWQPYIDNVVTHVVQQKGYEALPIRIIGGH
jgi:hypothetical protein